mgnify:CR=1 FL=1
MILKQDPNVGNIQLDEVVAVMAGKEEPDKIEPLRSVAWGLKGRIIAPGAKPFFAR